MDNKSTFSYSIQPNISFIEIYTSKNNAINIIIDLVSILNSDYKFDKSTLKFNNNDIIIMSRFGIKTPNIVEPDISNIKQKLLFIVNSNNDFNSINNILDLLNISIDSKNRNAYTHKLEGEYYFNNLERDYYFYDFYTKDQYLLPELFLIKTFFNMNNKKVDIIRCEDEWFLITEHSIDTIDKTHFKDIKNRLNILIDNALSSPYYALRFFPNLLMNNQLNYLNGIKKRLNKLNVNNINDFINSIKPACIFINREEDNVFNELKEKEFEFDNGLILLYKSTNNKHTEITVFIKDVLSVESFYSKAFAADFVFSQIHNKLNRWLFVPASPFSDIRIINGNFANSEFALEYTRFVKLIKQINIEHTSREKLDSIINIVNMMNNDNFRNIDLLNMRSSINYDALLLSKGELNILKKKLFSSNRIIIAVNTSLSIDSIIRIINKNPFFDTDTVLKLKNIDKGFINNNIVFINTLSNRDEILYLIKTFLNFPFAVNFYKNTIMYIKEYYYKKQLNEKNFYFNMFNRNGICILMALYKYLSL